MENLQDNLLALQETKFDCDEMKSILTNIVGEDMIWYDDKIAYGVDDEKCEDDYVYCSCYHNQSQDLSIRIYYGNNSRIIFDVDFYNY
jgi:hypothetical protein